MAWWFLGAVSAVAGIVMYMELGHTIPIYKFGNRLISVPRNGGELNYLKYIYQHPAYFTTCIFGICFILLGHVAMNGIAFGIAVLDAAGQADITKHDAVVRGIALTVSFGACFLHGTWRQGGIYLNNVLAVFKIAILLLIFALGMCALGSAFPKASETAKLPEVELLRSSTKYLPDAYGYAESFLAILFAFGGLNQANYVIGEVDDPRKRYKWPAFSAVVIVSILYLLCNWAYFIVVPTALFIPGEKMNVAHYLFRYTIGTLSPEWETRASQMLSAFVAISALGNIIVMTYTAARVKHEIAKEGVIPFHKFFARTCTTFRIPIRKLWLSKKETLSEEVPAGALVLHLSVSAILILTTWQMTATRTYGVLVDLYSYTVDAIFGTFLAFGLMYLRFCSKRGWANQSSVSGFAIPGYLSLICAFLFGIANLYPIAAKWVPPLTEAVRKSLIAPWWLTGTVGFIMLAVGILWWVGYRYIVPHIGSRRRNRILIVKRKLYFKDEDGYKVLEFEDVLSKWITPDEEGYRDGSQPVDEWAGARIREIMIVADREQVRAREQRERAQPAEMGGEDGLHQRHGRRPHLSHHNPNTTHEMHAAGSTPRM